MHTTVLCVVRLLRFHDYCLYYIIQYRRSRDAVTSRREPGTQIHLLMMTTTMQSRYRRVFSALSGIYSSCRIVTSAQLPFVLVGIAWRGQTPLSICRRCFYSFVRSLSLSLPLSLFSMCMHFYLLFRFYLLIYLFRFSCNRFGELQKWTAISQSTPHRMPIHWCLAAVSHNIHFIRIFYYRFSIAIHTAQPTNLEYKLLLLIDINRKECIQEVKASGQCTSHTLTFDYWPIENPDDISVYNIHLHP